MDGTNTCSGIANSAGTFGIKRRWVSIFALAKRLGGVRRKRMIWGGLDARDARTAANRAVTCLAGQANWLLRASISRRKLAHSGIGWLSFILRRRRNHDWQHRNVRQRPEDCGSF